MASSTVIPWVRTTKLWHHASRLQSNMLNINELKCCVLEFCHSMNKCRNLEKIHWFNVDRDTEIEFSRSVPTSWSVVYDRTTQINMIWAVFIISKSFGEMGQPGLMYLGPAWHLEDWMRNPDVHVTDCGPGQLLIRITWLWPRDPIILRPALLCVSSHPITHTPDYQYHYYRCCMGVGGWVFVCLCWSAETRVPLICTSVGNFHRVRKLTWCDFTAIGSQKPCLERVMCRLFGWVWT